MMPEETFSIISLTCLSCFTDFLLPYKTGKRECCDSLLDFFLKLLQFLSLFFFFFFLGPHLWRMEVPRLGVESELWLLAYTTATATYTTAHDNAGSLTHWARPEINPVSSWMLVRFVSAEPQWELHVASFFNTVNNHYVCNSLSNGSEKKSWKSKHGKLLTMITSGER